MAFDFTGYTEQQAMDLMYPKQLEAYKAMRFGHKDILITASGGKGKSFLIDAMMHFSKHNTVATALSGVAATNINGATTHSTMGLPLGVPTVDQMKKVSNKYRSLFKRDHPVENIIIDEASMMGPETWDSVQQRRKRIAKTAKSKHVRLLMFGDFMQLLNVVTGSDIELLMNRYHSTKLLDSKLWLDHFPDIEIHELDENKRSGADKEFAEKLEDLRMGNNIKELLEYFNKHVGTPDPQAIYLTTRNDIADIINKQALESNPNIEFQYHAKIDGDFKIKDSKVPELIRLKVGLRVMALYNDQSGAFVNGSTGTIVSLDSDSVEVKFDNGTLAYIEYFNQEKREYYTNGEGELCSFVSAVFKQLGAAVCAAISIHKCQGLSLEKITLDLGDGAFAAGQTYVGISRLYSIKGLTLLTPMKEADIIVDPTSKKFYASLRGEDYDPATDMSRVPAQYRNYKIRLLVCGGRDFNNFGYAEKCLDFMLQNYNKDEIIIVEGGATGADRMGRNYALKRGLAYKTFNANWKDITTPPVKVKENAYGKYNALAGLNRNKDMGNFSSHCLAFWDGKSTGTKDMINYMKSLMKPVKVFKY